MLGPFLGILLTIKIRGLAEAKRNNKKICIHTSLSVCLNHIFVFIHFRFKIDVCLWIVTVRESQGHEWVLFRDMIDPEVLENEVHS